MSRDDIVTAPTGGKKPATQQDLEPDIEFLPKFGAFLALTDLDNEWTDHRGRITQPQPTPAILSGHRPTLTAQPQPIPALKSVPTGNQPHSGHDNP